jgi:methionine synthase II (cobalamin-independent)
LESGGKIAWGIIPTLDSDALEKMTVQDAIKIFETSVKYLTEKGINEKLVIDNSIVTPSCGAGGLSEELAQKALKLTKELSEELKERYSP